MKQFRWVGARGGAELKGGDGCCHVCKAALLLPSGEGAAVTMGDRQLVATVPCGHVFHHRCAVAVVGQRLLSGHGVSCPECFRALG